MRAAGSRISRRSWRTTGCSHAGELPTEREANLQVLGSTQMQVQQLAESVNRDRDRRYLLERTLAELTAEPHARAGAAARGRGTRPSAVPGRPAAEQLQAARTVLRRSQLRFTPDHPDVQRAKRIVADLEVKAQQEALAEAAVAGRRRRVPATPQEQAPANRIRDLRLEIEGIDRVIASKQAEEKTLQARIAEYQRRVEATPARESELTSLLRDYDTVQKHYANLLAKQEDSKIAANLEQRQIGEQFRTLDQARLPERPISPNRPLIDLVGAMAGLAIGLGFVALLEYRDNSFQTDEEIVRSAVAAGGRHDPGDAESTRNDERRRRTWSCVDGGVFMVAACAAGVLLGRTGLARTTWLTASDWRLVRLDHRCTKLLRPP